MLHPWRLRRVAELLLFLHVLVAWLWQHSLRARCRVSRGRWPLFAPLTVHHVLHCIPVVSTCLPAGAPPCVAFFLMRLLPEGHAAMSMAAASPDGLAVEPYLATRCQA